MRFTPYDYQQAGIEDIVAFLTGAVSGDARGYTAPCSTGKSTIWAGAIEALPDFHLTVPTFEIMVGILRALGCEVSEETPEKQVIALGEANRIFTVKRYLNLLTKNAIKPPKYMGHDEGHHCVDDTHDSCRDLAGRPPFVILTATMYRGTPASTGKLLKAVNQSVTPIITLKDREVNGKLVLGSISRGINSLPEFRTLPLLDDELIDVSNGEFVVKSVESHLRSRIEQIVEVIRQHRGSDGLYKLAGTVVLSSAGGVLLLSEALLAAGLPCHAVLAGTKGRQRIFADTIARTHLLIQCRVVGEGVDLPLRWMLDLAPTMSPVLWMQRVGRIMRPYFLCAQCGCEWPCGTMKCPRCLSQPTSDNRVPAAPLYLGACHNLTRHGYLFEGLVPPAAFIEARKVWGKKWKPSRRMLSRALGNTGFGRFEPAEVPLVNGESAWMYVLKTKKGLDSYAAVLTPSEADPRYYHRLDAYTGQTLEFEPRPGITVKYPEKTRGKWERVKELPAIEGACSYPPDELTDGQIRWWQNTAAFRGLDPGSEVDAKVWMALPILDNTREKLK